MQNAKCIMQNDGIPSGDVFETVPKEHHNFAFCILHFEFIN